MAVAAFGMLSATLVGVALSLRSLSRAPDPVLGRLQIGGRLGSSLAKDLPRSLGAGVTAGPTHGSPALIQAGLRSAHSAKVFASAKLVLAALAPLGYLLTKDDVVLGTHLAHAVIACAAGYYAPDLWLRQKRQKRQATIDRSLPDCLDLLVTCVEAGQGLDAALYRVAQEARLSAPIFAAELHQTCLEVQAGIPRVEALRRLAERTGVEELRGLAATLAQTEMFGTSVGLALRTRAEWIRTRRMQNAEERAARVAVKMTIPLVLCILPSLIAIVMGPAIVRIARALVPNLGGP